jgi:hypothetical protein
MSACTHMDARRPECVTLRGAHEWTCRELPARQRI